MKEYKYLVVEFAKINSVMNEMAEKGWIVKATNTVDRGTREDVGITFEKDK